MSALLTPAEVTARLQISRQTLVRWEKAGHLVRDPSSSRPRFRADDVEDLAAARTDADPSRVGMLGAAADLLRERGVDGCTLDAVAERVGLTRAGVVYHHPTKEHLLEALVRQFVDDFDRTWQTTAAGAEPGPGRLCRTYAAATLHDTGDGLGPAVLSCAMNVASLREVVREALSRWYRLLSEEDLADGLDGEGLRMCLAADGLWVLELLHVMPLSRGSRRQAFPAGLPLHRRRAGS